MIKRYSPAPELITSHWFNTPNAISLKDLRGKVVVIEAFQMLCPGCVSHGIPQAMRIRQTFSNDDVVVLGLHTVFEHHKAQGTVEALEAFLHEYKISIPVAIDAASPPGRLPQTMAAYNLRGTPSLILIDRAGRVCEEFFGSVPDLSLGAKVMELLLDRNDIDVADNEDNVDSDADCTSEGCSVNQNYKPPND